MWQGFPIKVDISVVAIVILVVVVILIIFVIVILVTFVAQSGRRADGPNPAWLQRSLQLYDDQKTRRKVGEAGPPRGHGLVLQVGINIITSIMMDMVARRF